MKLEQRMLQGTGKILKVMNEVTCNFSKDRIIDNCSVKQFRLYYTFNYILLEFISVAYLKLENDW